MRNVAIFLIRLVILMLASLDALSLIGLTLTIVTEGPRGVVGHLAHTAFQGHWFPRSRAESDRIFWSYTGNVLALHFAGLVVLWVAWRIRKRLTLTSSSSPPGAP